MYIDNENFDAWMERIWEKLEYLERKVSGKDKVHNTLNGEKLFDNQDLCIMLNISKRTLQRYRSSGMLQYRCINRKLYYLESKVLTFIKENLKPVEKLQK